MEEIIFHYGGKQIKIQGDKKQKIEEVCSKFCNQINMNINSFLFNHEGNELNLNKTINEIAHENKIHIFVYEIKGRNEINCIYDKNEEEINLLHDYNIELKRLYYYDIDLYKEGRNNINGENIELYINDKKVSFSYKYKSDEKGEIKVKFIFKKLITSTHDMFTYCSSLKSLDFSYFNSSQVKDMGFMFYDCSSLKSIDLAPLDTSNVTNMNGLFLKCTSLESINVSSFNTSNVINMNNMFGYCKSLKSIDLSSFNTKSVNNMGLMFIKCESLISIDLSSFDISNCCEIGRIFSDCSALSKDNIKIKNSSKRILNEFKKIK